MNHLPNLQLSSDRIEKRAMYDLRRFLYSRPYSKNGKALDSRWFFRSIDTGEAGPAYMERLDLILAIKDQLEAGLESGGAIASIDSTIAVIQLFFDFCHNQYIAVRLTNVEDVYLEFCEHLFQKVSKTNSNLKNTTAYGYGVKLSKLFGDILDIPPAIELINRTRLRYSRTTKKAIGRESDKQNLHDTSKMGSFLIDLTSGITIDSVYGKLPIEIPIRNNLLENDVLSLTLNNFRSALEPFLTTPLEELTANDRRKITIVRKAREAVSSIRGTKRHYLVSLRVTAEFLVFLAQTGMNSAQARRLPRSRFKYQPIGDSWEVRCYKRRRGGEVFFKIYKSYKYHMEEYVKFLNHFFPDSDLLFPWFDRDGTVSTNRRFTLHSIIKLLKKNNIPWVSPRHLRNTRVNWCLRRSSGDAELTSEMHQHFRETLRGSYELPSQQRSMVELTRFWRDNDPIKKGELKISLISSRCSGNPVASEDKPPSVVSPNCYNQSGCLWCKNHRDLDSFDYVWSLASFRHLKTIEAASLYNDEQIPADLVVARLTEKIVWFRESTNKRKAWVDEAEMRISEGDYHPNWSGILEFVE